MSTLSEVDCFLIFSNPSRGEGHHLNIERYDHVISGDISLRASLEGDSGAIRHDLPQVWDGSPKTVSAILAGPPEGDGIALVGYEVVKQFPEQTGTEFKWDFDTTEVPDGQYALTIDHPDIQPFTLPVIIDNGNYDPAAPQYVAACPRYGFKKLRDHTYGWGWRYWPGHMPTIKTRRQPIRYSPRPEGEGYPASGEVWVQRMDHICNTPDQPFEWKRSIEGYPVISWKIQYHQAHFGSRRSGRFREGYPPKGATDNPAGGYIDHKGAKVQTHMGGNITRTRLDGYVEVLFGWRVPWSDLCPINAEYDNDSLYDFAGEIKDGPSVFNEPFDVAPDPVDTDIVYIADAGNHRVLRGNLKTKTLTHLYGHVDGSPGYHDGLSDPRSLEIGPDGKLYVADRGNFRILRVNRSTGEVEWKFESVRPRTGKTITESVPDWDGSVVSVPEHVAHHSTELRELAKWGIQGEAAFLYPTSIRFDSRGDLIVALDLQNQVARLTLSEDTPKLEHIFDHVQAVVFAQERAYPVLSVDRWGAFDKVDTIACTLWGHQSERIFDRDGNPAGIHNGGGAEGGSGFQGYRHGRKNRRAQLWQGNRLDVEASGYQQWVIYGWDGSRWHGGVSGGGSHRMTWAKPTDPARPDRDRALNGQRVWETAPDRHTPTLKLLFGVHGQNRLGGDTWDTLALLSDDEIRSWVQNVRPDIQGKDMEDLIYVIRAEATLDVSDDDHPGLDADEIPEPPNEEPDAPSGEGPDTTPELIGLEKGRALNLGKYECESRAPGVTCDTVFAFSRINYDPYNHRMIVFGGGHAATSRTDVDTFDLKTLKWSSLYPSMTCEQTSVAEEEGDLDPRGFYKSTGHPVARHSYDQNVIAPINGEPHLLMFSTEGFQGHCHGYNADMRSVPALPLTGEPVWKYSHEFELPWGYSRPAEYDSESGVVLCVGIRVIYFYDPDSEQIVETVDCPRVSTASTLTYFPPTDRMYLIDRKEMLVYEVAIDRSDLSATTTTLLETTGNQPDMIRNIAYSSADQILGGVVDNAFYAFHPEQSRWTRHPVEEPVQDVYHHAIDYDPVNNVFIFVSGPNSGLRTWAYKFDPTSVDQPVDEEPNPEQPEDGEINMKSVAMTGGMYHVNVGGEAVSDHFQFKEANQEALNQLLAGKTNMTITMDPITVEAN